MGNLKIKMILFDLDGTLLPMDQSTFVKAYFGLLAKKLSSHGYEPEKLIQSIWEGTKEMVLNNGQNSNEQVFWNKMREIYGEQIINDICLFDEYYVQDFDKVQDSCGFNENAKIVVDRAKELGLRVALATNPIFPKIATVKRVKWAGLDVSDFEYFTTYENSKYCKPNIEYYIDILKTLNVNPSECLMVGNDVSEDMIAKELGLQVFLLTDCLINKHNVDISAYPQGTFKDLVLFLEANSNY